MAHQKGEQRPQHKLKEVDVIKIRSYDKTTTIADLQKEFPHISRVGLWKARIGYTWKYLSVPPIQSRSRLIKLTDTTISS